MLTVVHSEKTEADLRLWVNYNLISRAAGQNFRSEIRFCGEGATLITAERSFESETAFAHLIPKQNGECRRAAECSADDT